MSTTLFLDFDGVLHPENAYESALFCRMASLETVLRDFSEVEIVISSTWRLRRSLPELKAYLSVELAGRVVGVTPVFSELQDVPDRLLGYARHAKCWTWQRHHRQSSNTWVALDDRPYLFRPFC